MSALIFVCAGVAAAAESPILETMGQELKRNFGALQTADPPPYFISYSVYETQSDGMTASLGTILGGAPGSGRVLDVSVRVGDRKLDNYRAVRGERPRFAGSVGVPIDNSPDALRRRLWLETDRVYRAGAQRLINIKTAEQTIVQQASVPDFTEEQPQKFSGLPAPLKFDRPAWTEKLRRWSAALGAGSGVIASQVTVRVIREVRYFADTEGARVEHGRSFARIVLTAEGKAADGMDLLTTESFEALEVGRLPEDARVMAAIQKVQKDLAALLRAPAVEPFIGPAILSGRAAGVFFHEIFGHRVEGHRQKDDAEGQTFAKSVGQQVLPEFLSVIFDATRRQIDGVDLNGWYDFDDEGVKAGSVKVVEAGVLKTFLLSRSPLEGFPQSNGHGRKQPGLEVVARQSNLIVESARQVPEIELRRKLLEEVKRQNKPYGLYFEHVTGGFTTTGRRGLQAFTVIPLVVYRVFADGRPDEVIRGADIVGTPLSSFAKILATGDKAQIFNGYCGAESGTVPVSAVSPAILVGEIEIQKKERAQDRPPFLPRPGEEQ